MRDRTDLDTQSGEKKSAARDRASASIGRRARSRDRKAQAPEPEDVGLREVFDSAGPMIIAVNLDGTISRMNRAAERMLGYSADELVGTLRGGEILAPQEAPRIISELQRLTGGEPGGELGPAERLAALMEAVRKLPPSETPSFEAQFLRKDGSLLPVTLHFSALRDQAGVAQGLVVIGLDLAAIRRQEQDTRESQDRFRDLFENSSEMIATLDAGGRFLYANPAWKRCFGLSQTALLGLNSFEEVFGPDCRSRVAGLFQRALQGEAIERMPIRNYTADGRVLEFELSLGRRQRAGKPVAVRCLMRDITQQKRRENRLALQLVVSQILGEYSSPEATTTHILEAICRSQESELSFLWEMNHEDTRLKFSTAWCAPGQHSGAMIHESMGSALAPGSGLPGRAWQEGHSIWIADLSSVQHDPRIENALVHRFVSGWAIPVRMGTKTLAVLEFYSQRYLQEDSETLASLETVAASIGQMLARSRERGRADELHRLQNVLLDSVADGICGIDGDGTVRFANPAAARLLGGDPERLTGATLHEVLHGAAPGNKKCDPTCALLAASKRQVTSSGEDTVYRADGTGFPAEYSFTPILDQGRFSGSVLSFRDISQRCALDQLKDEFISTVSHELRTPLTSIRGALGLLSSGILGEINEKAANLLRIASTNSDRLVRLINDILDLERIQSGREPIAFRPVQVSEVVRQAVEGMQPAAEAAGVRLLHEPTPVEISGDPDRLLQVLTNLLSNAIKFSNPHASVSVTIRPGSSGVTLSVVDQGRGIPEDKLESIFGRFQQVEPADSRKKGGSGLGLAICRTIIEQHSGRIWAERNPEQGSTFRLYLPYRQVASGPALDPTMPGTILLADANRVNRPLISQKLSRHGYRVLEAGTVEQTLRAVQQGVEAILLDTSLDGMNGFEILPMLRKRESKGHAPVVLLSLANQNPTELPAQAEGWVTRPIQEESLLNELARVLCGPGEKARVLVVEDDQDLARVICHVFSREAIEVQAAHTNHAARQACMDFRPHLLVLDIGLPDGDGFSIVEWLREHDGLANLPLVIYSGRDFGADERRELTLGPTHFLSKARVQPQQLEALVLTLLRHSRELTETSPTISSGRTS